MDIEIRNPAATDGSSVNQLVLNIPELDDNSTYCNLLQCTHFSETSAIAMRENEVVGFISGYQLPDSPDVLFIWQVAVSPAARGQGLGSAMLEHIIERPQCRSIRFLETTITEDNAASWALFERLARRYSAPLQRSAMFDRIEHFHDKHDTEFLARIGPFVSHTLRI